MSRIADVVPTPHLDSRSGFTVKVDVILESGARGWGAVPKGATPEKLRRVGVALIEEQEDPEAVLTERNVAGFRRDLAPKLIGLEALDQRSVDELLGDYNTRDNWARYGINTMLAASIAVARAAATERKVELFQHIAEIAGTTPVAAVPAPMVTVLEGGLRIANDLDFQALMMVPVGALSVDEAMRMSDRVFFALRDGLKTHRPPLNTSVGEQGGFVPMFRLADDPGLRDWRDVTRRALDLMAEAVESSGYVLGRDFCMAIDCAMTAQPYDGSSRTYSLKSALQAETGGVTADELISFYAAIRQSHAVWCLEDPLHQKDEQGWSELTRRLGDSVQLVGDDLFYDFEGVRSPRNMLRRYADEGIANSILVMPNRAGTLAACIDLIELARSVSYPPILSARARETEDDSVVDIAVACGCPQLRCGGLQCTERNSKYDRLRFIEDLLGEAIRFGAGVPMRYGQAAQVT